MKKIRVIVVDDESPSVERMKEVLSVIGVVEVVGTCSSGREAISLIKRERPDLVFLDIQMPDMDGFTILEQLDEKETPFVVFVTAYDEHAIRAFEVSAIDYILKPYDEARIKKVIARVNKAMKTNVAKRKTSTILPSYRGESGFHNRMFIKKNARIIVVKTSEIDWVEAKGDYVSLHFGAYTHLIHETLTGIESRLDPARFVRIHRSIIANIDRIREFLPVVSGDHIVKLQGGKELRMSRMYSERVFRLIKKAPS